MFIVEGEKIVSELLDSNFEILNILAIKEWNHVLKQSNHNIELVSDKDLDRISFFKNANKVLAVVKIPKLTYDSESVYNSLSLALDRVKDPGNLGSIIRTCDWFGVRDIYCSEDCVDAYNPKVVQASMGSIFRVKIHYVDLANFFCRLNDSIDIYGSFLEGSSLSDSNLDKKGIIVFGNESKGISKNLKSFITKKICINGVSNKTDSLNVASSVAIFLNTFINK